MEQTKQSTGSGVVAEPRSVTVEPGTARLHYLEWGDADRPVLLFQHPTGFTAGVWSPYAPHFLDRYRVLAPDNRGAGRSLLSEGDALTVPAMAADTIALLDHLGVRDAAAVGHSAGGTQLALVARQRPDLIRRLVLLDPVLAFTDGDAPAEGNSFLADQAEKRRPEFESRAAMRASYAGRGAFRQWRPEFLDAYIEWGSEELADGRARLRCTPAVEAAMFRGVPLPGTAAALFGAIRCPILVLAAGAEYGRTGDPRLVIEAAPDARLEVIEGRGHFFPYENPEPIIARIRRFLDE